MSDETEADQHEFSHIVDCQTCAKPNRLRFTWDMDDDTASGIAEPLRTEKDMRMLTGNPHFEKPRP